MKFGIKLSEINIEGKAVIGNVEVNVQYDAKELVEEYGLVKKIIKELPELVSDLGNGAIAFDEVDEAMNTLADAKTAEGATTETKATARNLVKNLIASIKGQLPKANAEQKPVEEKEAV